MTSLADLFRADGPLARVLPGYAPRQAQMAMADAVADALAVGEHLMVEAGTGIGKTFAYLVPLLTPGMRAVVSTGTKTLQDQLFSRDLPLIAGALGRPVEIALLKGRGNYLCWHRLDLARQARAPADLSLAKDLTQIVDWAGVTTSGDLTELADLGENPALAGALTSTSDSCLGARCNFYDDCFLVKARRRAQAADVVIVNHHLLMADLVLKDEGFGELLPGVRAVVVDEAHQLPDVAHQFFSVSLSSRQLELLARDLLVEARAAGLAGELEPVSDRLVRSQRELLLAVTGGGRRSWSERPPALDGALEVTADALSVALGRLGELAEASAGLQRCLERARQATGSLRHLLDDDGEEGVRWLELRGRSVGLHWTPLDTAGPLSTRISEHGGTWIFASATLAVAERFDHFEGRLGLSNTAALLLQSPFDFAANARCYLPGGLPQPAEPGYTSAVVDAVLPLIAATHGGVFMLFTSHRALQDAEQQLADPMGDLGLPLLVQGRGPRSRLLADFRAAGDGVLLGTASFWEGVDVRGDALRMVIIDKLPFASPGDPLVAARIDWLQRSGRQPFTEFQLPQAVLALKQGVGRLIRDFSDRGLVVLCDPRLTSRAYGRVFLDSLPPIPATQGLDEALEFACSLAPERRRRQVVHE